MKKLHLICNAHIDPVWQWTYDEGISAAIATYVLGYIADASGWTGAFILLTCITVFSALLAVIYLIFTRKSPKDGKISDTDMKENESENEQKTIA